MGKLTCSQVGVENGWIVLWDSSPGVPWVSAYLINCSTDAISSILSFQGYLYSKEPEICLLLKQRSGIFSCQVLLRLLEQKQEYSLPIIKDLGFPSPGISFYYVSHRIYCHHLTFVSSPYRNISLRDWILLILMNNKLSFTSDQGFSCLLSPSWNCNRLIYQIASTIESHTLHSFDKHDKNNEKNFNQNPI